MLQSLSRPRLDSSLHHQYLFGIHDRIPPTFPPRARGARYGKGGHPTGKAIHVLTRLRNLLDTDIHALHPEQPDIRRCSIYCNGSWVRYTRISFSILFSRFAGPSIYFGMRIFYVTVTIWTPYLIYFWFSVAALCVASFLFNPHQFTFADFIIDYREFLRWMSRGNSKSHNNPWIGYCRLSRTMITGYKKKKLGHPSEKLSGDVPCAGWRAVLVSEVIFPIVMAVLFIVAYMFVKAFPVQLSGMQQSFWSYSWYRCSSVPCSTLGSPCSVPSWLS